MTSSSPTIFLDLDGVLANFDKAAGQIVGGDHYRYTFIYGDPVLWVRLHSDPNFFLNMEMMPGAKLLLKSIGQPFKVLTALPKTNSAEVDRQKRAWVAAHVCPNAPVITCFSKDKPDYCQPGDILIDDRAINMAEWVAKGGRFILHESVMGTIARLEELGLTR